MILAGNASMTLSQIYRQSYYKSLLKKNTQYKTKALILGPPLKKIVLILRNSKVYDVYQELKVFGFSVDIHDPTADAEVFQKIYGFEKIALGKEKYDVVILAVSHKEFHSIHPKDFLKENGVVFDVKGFYDHPEFIYL